MNRKTPKINLKLSIRKMMMDDILKTKRYTGIQKSKSYQHSRAKQATFPQEVSLNTE